MTTPNRAVHWRYATKLMTDKMMPDNASGRILALFSFHHNLGPQPYEIFVISNPAKFYQ